MFPPENSRKRGTAQNRSENGPKENGQRNSKTSDGLRAQTAHPARSTLSWFAGTALLAALIIGALHVTDERAFVRLAERAEPLWLGAALMLQIGTYLAQGEICRVVLRAARVHLPAAFAFQLSLTMLFIDQALPSAGISGTMYFARALEYRGVPRAVVMAAVVVDSAGYYLTYIATLCLALKIMARRSSVAPAMLWIALGFVLLSVVLTATLVLLSGRHNTSPSRSRYFPLVGKVVALLANADPALARNPLLIGKSILLHLAIVCLDATTLWLLIRSLGEMASPVDVCASYMAASLLRTVSIVPGGLGVFEFASVVTLQHAGVSLAAALAATLLFRGLSFWLPMIPGLYFSRALTK